MNVNFHLLAFELLGIAYLPLPREDGFDGDPYLTDREYQTLCNIVCQHVPGMTAKDWWAASQSQRTACLATALQKSKSGRKGRPPKHETKGETLVRDALALHHKYESGQSTSPVKHGFGERLQTGPSLGNPKPATLKQLAELSGVDNSTVSRVLQKKFGSHDKYKGDCNQDKLGMVLALWTGDISEGHLALLAREYGRRDDDE